MEPEAIRDLKHPPRIALSPGEYKGLKRVSDDLRCYIKLLSFNSSFYHIRTFIRHVQLLTFRALFLWLSSTNMFIISSVRIGL